MVFESSGKKPVLLKDLLEADLIDAKTARKIELGEMSSEEMTSLVAKLRVFVDGALPIAGIINSSTSMRVFKQIVYYKLRYILNKTLIYEVL